MEDVMKRPVMVTRNEYNAFHSVDRDLYSTLVYDLWRDPVEAVQMMAIWLWLETLGVGFTNITRKILALPFHLINDVAEEALRSWTCINNKEILYSPSYILDTPLTHMLLEKEITLDFLRLNRRTVISKINSVIKRVCAKCLGDIMGQALKRNAAIAKVRNMTHVGSSGVHPDERTMFVTFSKGYPVAEWEVRDFFARLFGDNCIESLYMQEVGAEDQSLFARIVFRQPSYIHVVLDGATKAKFTINGKHVWMRKFVPKTPRRD